MSNNENQENVLRNLTIKLFSEFGAGKDENFCISPLNVYMALSSILCGSKNRTANQLKQFLQLNDLTNEQILALNKNNLLNLAKLNKLNGFKIDLMNRFYYSKKDLSLNTEFIENLQRFYESQIDFIDLNNSQYYRLINDQFANKYGHLIDSNTFDEAKLAQINATSFKGKWLNRFDAKQVFQDDFYLKDGTTVKVNMMQMKNREYLFKINPAGIFARTCTIPYMGESLAMTIILPHDGIDIEQVESQLTSEALKKIMYYSSNMYIGKVNIYLPKFKIDFKTEVYLSFSILDIFIFFKFYFL
jgi:serine protease inhibitor